MNTDVPVRAVGGCSRHRRWGCGHRFFESESRAGRDKIVTRDTVMTLISRNVISNNGRFYLAMILKMQLRRVPLWMTSVDRFFESESRESRRDCNKEHGDNSDIWKCYFELANLFRGDLAFKGTIVLHSSVGTDLRKRIDLPTTIPPHLATATFRRFVIFDFHTFDFS